MPQANLCRAGPVHLHLVRWNRDIDLYRDHRRSGRERRADQCEDTAISLAEDTAFSGQLPPAVDPDGDPVTYALAGAASHGTVSINANGTYSYIPDSNFNGTDSFGYSVSDGTATNVYRVSVNVSAVNDAPIGSDTSISAQQGAVATAICHRPTI